MNGNFPSGVLNLRICKALLLPISVLRVLMIWRHRRSAENRLGALSDHMLKDIAVSRGQIPFIASQEADWSRFR
ncbi:DUF1127 domain-containing protein [Rhizobium sp. Pop5]|nr:DUF1127 domain-containing protein [Rhizobium sp. Pop5]